MTSRKRTIEQIAKLMAVHQGLVWSKVLLNSKVHASYMTLAEIIVTMTERNMVDYRWP